MRWANLLLVVISAVASFAAAQEPRVLEPGGTLRIAGQLAEDDRALDDGTPYDLYLVSMPAGIVSVDLRSEAFDAYLIFRTLDEEEPAWRIEDDDGGWRAGDSRVEGLLPKPATLVVVATGYNADVRGGYELVLRSRPNDVRPLLPLGAFVEVRNLERDVVRLERQFLAGEIDSPSEAIALAERALEVRQAHQAGWGGKAESNWWALADARLSVQHLRLLAALSDEDIESLVRANELHRAGMRHHRDAEYAVARESFEGEYAIREQVLGLKHPDTATNLNNLAELLRTMGDYEGARPLYERALRIGEQILGPEHPNTALSLSNLGLLLHTMGDYEGARPLFERALRIREQVLGPEHPSTATGLNNLAELLRTMGDYEGARPLYERALRIWEDVLGPEHPDTASSLNNLGFLLHTMGDYERARLLHERALRIREQVLGPEHPDTARSLNNLGILLHTMGEYDNARPLHEQALRIREDVLGPMHPDTASSLNNLAELLRAMGEYDGARPLYERALRIRKQVLGPEHSTTAWSINNLAVLLRTTGDYDGARSLYERSLQISEHVLGPEHPDTATSLNNLAELHSAMGDYDVARPLYERALRIREDVLGPEHPDTAQSLNNLGILLRTMGDYESARPLYERALRITEQVLAPEHPDTATSLNNLAELLLTMGDYEGARPLYERALRIKEQVLGPEHPDTARSVSNLLALLADVGDVGTALAKLQGADASGHLTRTLRALSDRERFAYFEAQRWHTELAVSLARVARTDEAGVLAYDRVLGWNGEVSRVASSLRQGLAASMTDEQEEMLEELRLVQGRISWLLYNASRERRDQELPGLLEERQTLELALNRLITLEQERGRPSFANLTASLPENAAAVDFLVHDLYIPARWEDGERVESGRWTQPRVSCWITRPGFDAPIWLDLGPAAELEALVKRFLEDLVQRRGIGRTGDRGPTPNDALRAALWAPLTPHLEGTARLIISPDRFLATLPMETLQDEDGSFLLEQFAITYLQDLSALARMQDLERAGHESLLAVGGVDFLQLDDAPVDMADATSPDVPRGGFHEFWERLPATTGESQAIFDLHSAFRQGDRELLQGAEATEEQLKFELERFAVLHLATHGFFEPEGVPSMWEEVRGSGRRDMTMRASDRRLVGYHPGLLSGLVCAGANLEPEEGRDDAYLTAEELGWLDLSGADLVVLSACETGLGRARSGEGLIGLRRAILTAGARTVISSLWRVRDDSTSNLMRRFYLNLWKEGMTTHEALREAQLWMLHSNLAEHGRPMPSTWGAFVLDGRWE